jgi:hypothetical protein
MNAVKIGDYPMRKVSRLSATQLKVKKGNVNLSKKALNLD